MSYTTVYICEDPEAERGTAVITTNTERAIAAAARMSRPDVLALRVPHDQEEEATITDLEDEWSNDE